MQVERERDFGPEYSGERASNAYLTYLQVRDSSGKPVVIPHNPVGPYGLTGKGLLPGARGASYQLVGKVTAYQG